MAKPKQVKKSKTNSSKASSSSKSGKNGMIIVVDGPMEKKLKTEAKAVTVEEVEVEIKSFDDLPTEMVMKILKQLDDKDLFRCRLVNRHFNGVASELLQSNTNVEFRFEYAKIGGEMRIKRIKRSGPGRAFKNLIKCFEESPNFPCSRLRFDKVLKSFFAHEDWTKLIDDHGDRIKCLILDIASVSEDDELIQITKGLRQLLLKKLPNLKEFGLRYAESNASSIQLFRESTRFQLPHLKVLHLDESSFSNQTGIVTNLLDAAINLQKIELFPGMYKEPIKNVYFLHSLGKLHLLQRATIHVGAELLSSLKLKDAVGLLEFKLKELELTVYVVSPDAIIFISNLFESSKDTLTKIKMCPLGLLKNLQLPAFKKLTNLSITNGNAPLLPSGAASLDIFPALRSLELELPWATAFPQKDSVPVIPSLVSLRTIGDGMKESHIAQIPFMAPNLKHFNSDWRKSLMVFNGGGRAIWTHLNKLESLEISVNNTYGDPHSVDSCITGISREECKRLFHLLCAEKSLKLAGSQHRLPKSEWKAERENVSILNMKDLKTFTLHVGSRDSKMAMTEVSEEYGLNFMENLTYKIEGK